MKLARPIILIPAAFLLLGGLAFGLALTPGIQRWAVLREAKKHPGLNLQLEAISAGPASVTLRGVQLEHRGVTVTCGRLEADYSLWAYLFDGHLDISKISAEGLIVDTTRLSAQKAQAGLVAGPVFAPGALARVKLPWELSVGTVAIEGRIVLAGTQKNSAIQAELKLSGGNIAPGRAGELLLTARITDPDPAAHVAAVTSQTALQIRESPSRTFDHLRLTSVLEATGSGMPGPVQLKLLAEVTRAAGAENYQVKIDTLRSGQEENLLSLQGHSATDGQSFGGDWKLSARAAQLEPFILGQILPAFTANGAGKFSLSPATQAVSLQGSFQIEAADFKKIRPELHAVGSVRLKGNFDLSVADGVIRCPQLAAVLSGEQPVLELRAIGSPTFNLGSRRFESTGAASAEVLQLKLAGLPLAWLAPFVPSAQLSGGDLTGTVSVAPGEGGKLTLRTITPLQVPDLTVARAGKIWVTKAALQIDGEADYSAAGLSATIRRVALDTAAGDKFSGKLQLSSTPGFAGPAEVEGSFTADLPALLQPVQPGAVVKAKGTVALAWQPGKIGLRRGTFEATDAAGDMLASVLLIHGFDYNPGDGTIDTADLADGSPLASIRIGQLPLITLPQLHAGLTVSGKPAPAEAIVSKDKGRLLVRTGAPLTLLDFSVLEKKRLLLDRLKVILNPELVFEHGVITQIKSGDIAVENATEVPLAQLRAEITQGANGLRAMSSFTLDLPAWTSQPVLLGRDVLATGQASGELRAALTADAAQIEARATFNNLVALEGNHTLPVANLSLRADLDSTGKFSLQVPVLLDRAGQRSDLRLAAEGRISPLGLVFEGRITSEHLELKDLLVLLASAGSPLGGEGAESLSAQTRALSPPSADPVAAWSGLSGGITVDCKSVVGGADWALNGLSGRLTIKDDQLLLEKLEGSLDEKNGFSAKGALTFAAGLNPYHLTGDFTVTGFDAGKFFRAIEPEQVPVVEGLFSVKAQLEGEGLTFDDTLDRTYGTYDLTSRQGVFRGLRKTTDKLSMVTKTMDLLGAFIGDKSAEKIAPYTYFADQLAQDMAELKYDQLTVRLVREPSLNLRLDDFMLVAQTLHLIGSGQVAYVAGTPLLKQPFQATLALRARGKAEELLGKIKELEGTRDVLGYAKTKTPVTLRGTLSLPNPDSYFLQVGASRMLEKLNEAPAPAP